MIYLDNAATTAVSKKSADAAKDILDNCFGNPSSLYSLGAKAESKLSSARRTLARVFGCTENEIYFTGCGTESNNLALLGAARARAAWADTVVTTAFEHPSVQNTVRELASEGFKVIEVKPRGGVIDPQELLSHVGKTTALVAVMQVNNETGAVNDAEDIAKRVKEINPRTAFHCDAVQGFMKQPLSLVSGAIDTVSVSGHKLHAPKGVGALYVRKGFNLKQVQFGGGQERGLRSGTENLAFAAAFAAAISEPDTGEYARVTALRDKLRDGLSSVPDIVINSPQGAAPYILNFSVLGYRSETLIHFLEEREIYVSGGSACSKGQRSHTLSAMGLPVERIDSALRVSFCGDNREDDVDALLTGLEAARKTLRRTR